MICLQKNVSLIFWTKQQFWMHRTIRCDLVTKKCIFDILNNARKTTSSWDTVVIWLQKNVSLIFWTTHIFTNTMWYTLWFGYKKMYLWYSEQHLGVNEHIRVSCDLVTKKCIFDILNNLINPNMVFFIVVIWLQKNVSLIFWTTSLSQKERDNCCDLVTKKCIFDILNNKSICNPPRTVVVIWLQKNVSLIFWTTARIWTSSSCLLWFGYKKMYLW